MNLYTIFCFLFVAALFVNWLAQFLQKIQSTIVITGGGVIVSLLIVLLGHLGMFRIEQVAEQLMVKVDFEDFLLNGILGFLLFSGSLNINLTILKTQKWEITILALMSTLLSTILIGFGLYAFVSWIHLPIPLLYCFIFGAVISPTDPIAVLAIIKKLHAPTQIAIQVEGESLFNDGVGLVIFATLFAVSFGGHPLTVTGVSSLFLIKAVGGIIYGAIIGTIVHIVLKHTGEVALRQLITLLIPTAGFVIANVLEISGALAMVVSGILIGNMTRPCCFKPQEIQSFNYFWEIVEHGLNALLFLLIGLSLLTISFHPIFIALMIGAIVICLIARYISVALPFVAFRRWRHYNPWTVKILTWGGLRGGLGLAMALSIPAGKVILPHTTLDIREIILVCSYAVVVFSILIQGATITNMITKARQYSEEHA